MRYIILNALFALILFVINVILGKILSGNLFLHMGDLLLLWMKGKALRVTFSLKLSIRLCICLYSVRFFNHLDGLILAIHCGC